MCCVELHANEELRFTQHPSMGSPHCVSRDLHRPSLSMPMTWTCHSHGSLPFSSLTSLVTCAIACLNSSLDSTTILATSSSLLIAPSIASASAPGETDRRLGLFLGDEEALGVEDLGATALAPGVFRARSSRIVYTSSRCSVTFFMRSSLTLVARSSSFDCARPPIFPMPSKNSSVLSAPSPVSSRSKISLQFFLSMPSSIRALLSSLSSKAFSNSPHVSWPSALSSISLKMALNLFSSSSFAFSSSLAAASASFAEFWSALSTMTAVTRFIITMAATAM
mmetsp:Transcript_20931/g.62414  ORF Transcript_20931/g.62414 Transcript_20931/m.62414 type:complete len:280 (-) Transcript_20931:944-1783(-)